MICQKTIHQNTCNYKICPEKKIIVLLKVLCSMMMSLSAGPPLGSIVYERGFSEEAPVN